MIWILLLILVTFVCYKTYSSLSYWKKRNVPQKNVATLLQGLLRFILRDKSFPLAIQEFYQSFPNARYMGIYQMLEPILLVKDPDLIKQISVKDFDHFIDHRNFIPDDAEPLWTRNLLSLKGQKWKDMRATLSPAFTARKMKMMHSLIETCSQNYAEHLSKETKVYELKDVFTRFANDVIATAAFGIEVDSWQDKEGEFYLMGKEATNLNGFWKNLNFIAMLMMPKLAQMLGLRIFSKKTSDFFMNLITNTVRTREEKGIIRQDMIHLMMEAKKAPLKHEDQSEELETGFATVQESHIGKSVASKKLTELTDVDMTAQALIFFFAGFDTVSTTMCFMAYELAVNPDIQEKLRKEITQTLAESNNQSTYDAIMKMKYMDMVISETLRKWPGGALTDRKCVKTYTIEPSQEGEEALVIEEGSTVWFPVYPLHRDAKYWPNPDKFDPERFNEENKSNINPYTYLAFGAGPRNCVGSRFALMEIKTMFVNLLSKVELRVCEETPIPMKLSRYSINLAADPGFYVKMVPRTDL